MASMTEFYLDGEVVSREVFWARTTPIQRIVADKQSGSSGGPSVYLTAEEWVADGVAAVMEANPELDEEEVRRGKESYEWSPDHYGPDFSQATREQWARMAEATARRRAGARP